VAQFKKVELVDGRVVKVYRPPYTRIHANVRKRLPEPLKPEVPIVTEENVTGREISMPIPTDPDYLAAVEVWRAERAEWEERYNEEVDRMRALFVLKDVQVPDGWDAEQEFGEEMRFFDPEWEPTPGEMGRKLDYILWDIMGDGLDANRILDAEAELSGIDVQEVVANEASFQDNVEEPTDPDVAGEPREEGRADD
jgi:hypothetical protein